jgi:hypothetical protein
MNKEEKRKKFKSAQDEFITKSKEMHGNKYDYSESIYEGSLKNITIKCPIHGLFTQLAKNHLKGSGCLECGRDNSKKKQTLTTEEFIKRAKKIHEDNFDYSETMYIDAHTNIKIKCKQHNKIFEQQPCSHLNGAGCEDCKADKIGATHRQDLEWFIEKANEVHNNKYDYSQVIYKNSREKVLIKCKEHGEFYQIAGAHIFGRGCYDCGQIKSADKCRNSLDEFIEKSVKFHGEKYDYSKVNYINNKTKIIIICKNHGEFSQEPSSHMRGWGCIKCLYCPNCLLFRTNGQICFCCKGIDNKIKYIKEKELAVIKFLRENLSEYEFTHNKSVGTECTGGRLYPDVRFDFNYYNLIVEIDEFEHRGTGYECDKARMYDIIAKLGMPCIFIRYNPDNKDSSLEILSETIKQFAELDINDVKNLFDNYGFKVIYLFYSKK